MEIVNKVRKNIETSIMKEQILGFKNYLVAFL